MQVHLLKERTQQPVTLSCWAINRPHGNESSQTDSEDEDNYNADSRVKFRASRATNECKRPLLGSCPLLSLWVNVESRTENLIPRLTEVCSSWGAVDGEVQG
jgi:hypothetical protein